MSAPPHDHPKPRWPRRLPPDVPCEVCQRPSCVAEGPPLNDPDGPWRFLCGSHRSYKPLPETGR